MRVFEDRCSVLPSHSHKQFVSALSDAREINEDFSFDGAGLECAAHGAELDLRFAIYDSRVLRSNRRQACSLVP